MNNKKIDFEELLEYAVQYALSEISDTMGKEFLSSKNLDLEFKNHVKNKFSKYKKVIKELNAFFDIFEDKKSLEIFKYDKIEYYSFHINLLESGVSGKFDLNGSSEITIFPSNTTSIHFNRKTVYGEKTKDIEIMFSGYQKEDGIFKSYLKSFLDKEENIKISRNIRFFLEDFNKHVWKARQKKRNIMVNKNTVETLIGIDLFKITQEEIDLVSLKSDVDVKEEVSEFKNNHKLVMEKANTKPKKKLK